MTITAPKRRRPLTSKAWIALGASFWLLQLARELDDAILHLRINELDTALLVFKSHGEQPRPRHAT